MLKQLLTVVFLLSAGTLWAQQAAGLLPVQEDTHCKEWVEQTLSRMKLKDKVGQLFVYTLAPRADKDTEKLVGKLTRKFKVGAFLYSEGTVEDQANLTNYAQRQSKIPLMITFDGEWGLAMRLENTPVFPRNAALGCISDNTLIEAYGQEVARELREIGAHVNFAPDADVNTNPENPVIHVRSFGENPKTVAEKVIAYGRGLETGGILSVSKHFPGHGDTDVDSHQALPAVYYNRARLDSVELYPFKEAIQAGLGGVMVGHLQVPALEPDRITPSSLSHSIVTDLLRGELGFNGLVFTDALAMKGVAAESDVTVKALKAGNDMVLAPRRLKEEMDAVLEAVEKGELPEEEINAKCRKVLTYKYILGLERKPFVKLSGLGTRINTPQTRDLISRLNLAAITVLNNKNDVLPLHPDLKEAAILNVGKPEEIEPFDRKMKKYTSFARFQLRKDLPEAEQQKLRDSLAAYRRVIVTVTEQRLAPYQSFFAKFAPESPVIYVFYTPAKSMLQIQRAVSAAEAVVLAHASRDDVQERVADLLFGKATADGRLSASIGGLFPTGSGVTITPHTPFHFVPEEYGMKSEVLRRIDTIALEGIKEGAYPGCQVLVMKDGKALYDRCFGYHTDANSEKVKPTDIYDLASLSKTTGTLLAIMKLYDKGRFNLTDKVSDYLPFLRKTNKENLTIRELLMHQSGLPSGLLFYQEAIDGKSYKGSLFKQSKDALHTVRLGVRTWGNPRFRFNKGMASKEKNGDYTLQVCDSLWLNRSFREEIRKKIAEAPLKDKSYRYSDVGFILLQMLAEELSGKPMDEYLWQEFYQPMGLEHTAYLPLRYFDKKEVVPSAVDRFLRKTTLQGFVHDESAAFQGGISGNAGLFSNAREVGRIYQMLLNGGELDGRRYLSKETCALFTTEKSKISRRGLGFDKPDVVNESKSPCAASVPVTVYGHTGFTGTCAWVDPDNGLIYVFLSNRTYPDAWVNKLSKLEIREKIQETIYEAMKEK